MTTLLQKLSHRIHWNRRAWECMAFSMIAHCILFLILSLFLFPPKGRPDAGIEIDINVESFSEPTESFVGNQTSENFVPEEDIAVDDSTVSENVKEIQNRMKIEDSQQLKQYLTEREKNIAAKKKLVSDMLKQQGKISSSIQVRGQYGTLAPRSFYGIKIVAKSMIFMLDISGSMSIEDGARQLKNSYQSLTPTEYFNIVVYAESPQCWQSDLVLATPQNIQLANHWVDTLKNGGATDLHSALDSAFQKAWKKNRPEIIYLISDGLSTFGEVQQDILILDAVRKWNQGKNIILYVIGLGYHQNKKFLKQLAVENYGKYFER